MIRKNIKKIIGPEFLSLLGILILSASLRFYHLRTVPDWFMDEGEFIRLADYLSKGNFNFLGIRNSLLLIGRPPFFLWVLAGAFKLFGTDILILRSLTVLCSILTIGVCFFLARRVLGTKTAIYSALLLAILPDNIYNNRIGFTYNWTALWMLFFVFALWMYLERENQRWLVVACLASGVAFASDYVGIISVLILLFVLIRYYPKRVWYALLIAIPLLASILPIFIVGPADAWQDLKNIFIAGAGSKWSLIVTLGDMIVRYANGFINQVWIVVGVIGIFTLPDKRLRGLFLAMLAGTFFLFSYSRDLSGHYLLVLWPFIMIGTGCFLERSIKYLYNYLKLSIMSIIADPFQKLAETTRSSLVSIGSTLLLFIIVYLPMTWVLILSINSFLIGPMDPANAMRWNPYFHGFVSAADAQAVAQKILPTLKPDDFVVAPGVIFWMLPSHEADARTVAAYEYGGEVLGQVGFDQARFTVDSSLTNAKYAIVDNSWRAWMVNLTPEIANMLREVSNWPLIMAQGSLQLYCNPRYCQ